MFPPYLVAFAIGLYIALNDLFSSSNLFLAFAKKSVSLWALGAIYGLLSVGFYFLLIGNFLDFNIESAIIKDPISNEAKSWIFACFAGISIKSLLTISFYNFRFDGDKTFPIGLATFVKIFEPQLLKIIETDHYIAFDNFLTNAEEKTSNLSLVDIHNVIRNKILTRFSAPEVSGFLLDLAAQQNARESFTIYLRAYGKRMFCHTFPACKPAPWWQLGLVESTG